MENIFLEGLLRYLSKEELAKIASCHIAIAGAGGLGSNAAHNLVRCGFSHLTIADFDAVSASNLNRQFFFADQIGKAKVEALRENLMRINPEIDLTLHYERVTKENAAALFGNCNIWIEAFDGAADKQMLAETGVSLQKHVICASGIAGFGNSDEMTIHKLGRYLYIVGDLKSGIEAAPPLCPRVALAAAKQADIALSLALERE